MWGVMRKESLDNLTHSGHFECKWCRDKYQVNSLADLPVPNVQIRWIFFSRQTFSGIAYLLKNCRHANFYFRQMNVFLQWLISPFFLFSFTAFSNKMYVQRSVIGAKIVLAYRVQNLAKAGTFIFTQITVRNQESIYSDQLGPHRIIFSLALIGTLSRRKPSLNSKQGENLQSI